MQQNSNIIKKTLDRYFDFTHTQEKYALAFISEMIPPAMLDVSKPAEDDWAFWLPIQSTVTDQEIASLEKILKHALPSTFRYFLQQRHFMELHFDQYVNFFSILPEKLAAVYKENIEKKYPDLPVRHYLPFAHYGNFGVACFDATKAYPLNDYSIVWLDHADDYQQPHPLADNFLHLFEKLEEELNTTIKQIADAKNK